MELPANQMSPVFDPVSFESTWQKVFFIITCRSAEAGHGAENPLDAL